MPTSNSSSNSNTSDNVEKPPEVVRRRHRTDRTNERAAIHETVPEVHENVKFIKAKSTQRPLSDASTFYVQYDKTNDGKEKPPFRAVQSTPVFNKNLLQVSSASTQDINANHRSRKSASAEPPEVKERKHRSSSAEARTERKNINSRPPLTKTDEISSTPTPSPPKNGHRNIVFTFITRSRNASPARKSTDDKVWKAVENLFVL